MSPINQRDTAYAHAPARLCGQYDTKRTLISPDARPVKAAHHARPALQLMLTMSAINDGFALLALITTHASIYVKAADLILNPVHYSIRLAAGSQYQVSGIWRLAASSCMLGIMAASPSSASTSHLH